MSFNKVILQGRLGRDAETKVLQSGKTVVNFSIATEESWFNKGKGEREKRTDWHNISWFAPDGSKLVPYLTKGAGFLIEGKLRTDKYEKDGDTKFRTYVLADQIHFLDVTGKGDGAEEGGSSNHTSAGKPSGGGSSGPRPGATRNSGKGTPGKSAQQELPIEGNDGGGFEDDSIPF